MGTSAVSTNELAAWSVDGAERALQLVDQLTDEEMIGPLLPTVNPLLWEIGHLAWFQEKFVLRQACGHDPILEFGDALYDSGSIPHDTRWCLALPSRQEAIKYVRTVAERVADEVAAAKEYDVVCHFARYTVHHYDTHTEALTYTLQTHGHPLPVLPDLTDAAVSYASNGSPATGDVRIEGGRFLMGGRLSDPFVYDNEKWAHPVEVAPFSMARATVTQGEFAQFVDDGGYDNHLLWSDGAAWLRATGAQMPLYWRRADDGSWQRRHFENWVPLEADLPVSHVCWWEADAFCRWAGRRLPTESEWELAATAWRADRSTYPWGDDQPVGDQAATDWRSRGPVSVHACPDGDSPDGVRQLIGNVWEWTSSDFNGYPNFERDAYFENSEQFFGQRKVLRGGAWPTRGRYTRSTLRNYFTEDRRDVIAGFRTCSAD